MAELASFIHHIELVYAHHRKVKRVAMTCNGISAAILSKLADHFVAAEIKQFSFEQMHDAVQ